MTTRVGSVPYLNEKPLTRWFTHTDEGRASGYEVVYEVPSKLAVMLAEGEIEAALVSSFEYFRTPGYAIVPGVSISGQGEILSVRAFSKLPWRMVESVALDTSSLTSSALLKIILAEVYNSHPGFINCDPDFNKMMDIADAALLIGDAGMLADGGKLDVIDLGKAWRRHTALPFVYAIWLAPPNGPIDELSRIMTHARDWGLTQTTVIAKEQAERLGCSEDLCYEYLTQIMDYWLDKEHYKSLETFGAKAHEHGLLAVPPTAGTVLPSVPVES